MILVAAGLIYRDDGKLLIAQRPAGKHGAFKWEFPGGKIEENEDPRDCLVREVREELGVEVSVGSVIETIFHHYPERSVLLLFYRCKWVKGEPQPLECHAFDWADPKRLTDYDFLEADLNFIRKLAADYY
jgi:8-oxo-dGTP diphosphatase